MIALTLVGLVLDVISTTLYGVALKILWAWYMVPIFGLPKLTIPQAIGVAICVGLITHQYIPGKANMETIKETILGAVSDSITAPLFALIFGAVVHLFV
jgi:hypothetical protein